MTTIRKPFGRRTGHGLLLMLAAVLITVAAMPAGADAASPAWKATVSSLPTNFAPGSSPTSSPNVPAYVVVATNIGGAPTSGPMTFKDTLPAGITSVGPSLSTETSILSNAVCATVGQVASCTVDEPVLPGQWVEFTIPVSVDPLPDGTTRSNAVDISGGGAAAATVSTTTTISTAVPSFDFLPGANGLAATLTDADGLPVTRAGAHPHQLTIDIGLATEKRGIILTNVDGGIRDLRNVLPRGLIVNPNATPARCTEAQLESAPVQCPAGSQVGLATVLTVVGGIAPVTTRLFNMVPPSGVPAMLGFDATGVGIFVHIKGGVHAGDYSLSADTDEILARGFNPLLATRIQIWGDKTDISSPVPFLTMPGACSDSLTFSADADSWLDPLSVVARSVPLTDQNGDPTGVSGCSELAFDPQIGLAPTSSRADSSSGMDVDLQVPQTNDVSTRATANLKKAVVTLPKGAALNPSAANGLAACTEAEIGLTSTSPIAFDASDPTCPEASQVGTATIDTPLLSEPLGAKLYLADPNDNPFNTLLSGYLVAQGQGLTIKLAGKFDRDPDTGQITAVFDDNPQLPFSDLKLHFKGGDNGVLVTPPTCGTYTTDSQLSPWSAVDPEHPTATEMRNLVSSFAITSGPDGGACPDLSDPARFTPGFSAGTVSPQAGAYSPFVLKVSRADGQQSLKKVAVALPLGLTAKLAGVPRCAQSAIVPGVGGSASCPADSQVGTVTVGAGAGSSPFFLADQPVYLTDGYDGAPFGLVIDTHAVAGPFDLGHVVVRTKLNIDPITTQVSADSEPLPSIIQGIPLHIRSVTLKMDRSSFVLNPTSCAAQTVTGQITGGGANFADPGDDTVKGVSSPFQVGGCSSLGLSPKLAISLTGKGQTTDDKHPGVHATVSQTPGQANLKKVVVSLPLSLALDPDNANGLCEFTDGSKVEPTCPKASIVGKAVAHTPILDQPLTGPVYFVKNIRKDAKTGREIRTLPKLVIPLTGENGLRLNLVGTSNVVNNRLVTTFDNIPDAPVSDFTLDINGGKGGILVVSGADICKATQVADQQVDGQNGKTADANVYLQTPACALKIISKKVGKTTVAVKIGGLSAGKVTVTGHGIKKTTKTITKSTVATITAKRTKGKPGKVTVSFDPTGPAKAHKTTK